MKLSAIRLGGYQRIWVCLSVLYLVVVAFLTIHELPKNALDIRGPYKVLPLMQPEAAQNIVEILEQPPVFTPTGQPQDTYTVKTQSGYFLKIRLPAGTDFDQGSFNVHEAFAAGYTQPEIEEFLNTKGMDVAAAFSAYRETQAALDPITSAFDRKMTGLLTRERLATIGKGFAAWIIPVAALYVLGWAVGWICRGFKESTP